MNKSKQNNITKNMLSLKAMDERMRKMEELTEAKVRAELASDLNALKTLSKGAAAKRFQFSSLFSPAFMIFSVIITNLHKIPLVGKLIKILGLWYGKSTWWQMLVIIRKIIIITNALIGFYALIKISGFSIDNIGAGIACFGATYFETLRSLIVKIFNWFYDFFDYRTPNPPTEPGGSWWFKAKPKEDPRWWGSRMFGWYGKDMMGADSITQPIIDLSKGQEFYNPFKSVVIEEPRGSNFNPFNWSSWVWYTIFGVISIGCAYYGYKWVIQEANAGLLRDWPPFGNWWNPNRGAAPAPANAAPHPVVEVENPTPPVDPVAIPNPDPGAVAHVYDPDTGGFIPVAEVNRGPNPVVAAATALRDGAAYVVGGVREVMNPFNWFVTPEQVAARHREWLDTQANSDVLNQRLYPFTPNNPADTYGQKFYKAVFGETAIEQRIREGNRATVYQNWTLRHGGEFDPDLVAPNMGELAEDIARAASPAWSAARDMQNQTALQQLPTTPTGELGNSPWHGVVAPKPISPTSSVEEIMDEAATDVINAGGGAKDWGEVPKIREAAVSLVAPQPVQAPAPSVATQLAQVVEQAPQNVPQPSQVMTQAPQDVPQNVPQPSQDVPQTPQELSPPDVNTPQIPHNDPQLAVVAKNAAAASQAPQTAGANAILTSATSSATKTSAIETGKVLESVAQKLQTAAVREGQGIKDLARSLSPLNLNSAALIGKAEAAEIVRSVTPTPSITDDVTSTLASLPTPGPSERTVTPVTDAAFLPQESSTTQQPADCVAEPTWQVNNLLDGPMSYRVTGSGGLAHALKLFAEDIASTLGDPAVKEKLVEGSHVITWTKNKSLEIFNRIESSGSVSSETFNDLKAIVSKLNKSLPLWEDALSKASSLAEKESLQTEATILINMIKSLEEISEPLHK